MATATVYKGAKVTLNGKNYGVTSAGSFTITGVTKALEVDNVTCADGTASTLFTVSATEGGNTLTTVKYVEVTNNETSGNAAIVGVIDTSAKAFYVEVPAGQTKVILLSDDIDANTSGGAFSTLTEINSVTCEGRGATASVSFLALGT